MKRHPRRSPAPGPRPSHARQGMVLLLVLVVIAMLSLAGYTFCELMYTERQSVDLFGRGLQSQALCDSGLELAQRFLVLTDDEQREYGGVYDNPITFQAVQVTGDELATARERGRFTLLAPALDENGVAAGWRYGMEDESTRLNLNTLILADQYAENGGRQLLMALPGMTEDIADAILDWIDSDDEPREFGAERDHYSGLDPPYAPKNAPLETVEELLLVRGMTPWLLFGPDANRNGRLDAHEPPGDAVDGVDNSDGSMTRGWAAYLTLYSLEKNVRPDGSAKINLNNTDLEALYTELEGAVGAEWATFIVAYRQNGPYTGTNNAEKSNGRKLDLTRASTVTFQSVLDLIGQKTQARFSGGQNAVVLDTPFPAAPIVWNAYLPILMDNCAVNVSPIIPGRININQAPRAVLAGVPGITEEILQQILSSREPEVTDEKPDRRHETWLLTENICTLDEMKAMIPYVCAGGHVFRTQVVGYYDEGGPASRIEAVLDGTSQEPRVLLWRDISHLGRGYALETLGVGVEP